jgi:ARP2/3 complex ARPC3 (21 kDa) subunit
MLRLTNEADTFHPSPLLTTTPPSLPSSSLCHNNNLSPPRKELCQYALLAPIPLDTCAPTHSIPKRTILYLLTRTTNAPQAYNSIFNADSSLPTSQVIGNFPLLPLRTRVRGPAYTLPLDASLPAHLSPEPDSESYDALDEVLSLFRANTFFRNFEIQGPADRLMIYGILWVSECLGKIRPSMSGRYVEAPGAESLRANI